MHRLEWYFCPPERKALESATWRSMGLKCNDKRTALRFQEVISECPKAPAKQGEKDASMAHAAIEKQASQNSEMRRPNGIHSINAVL
jgi:hypothetical protein